MDEMNNTIVTTNDEQNNAIQQNSNSQNWTSGELLGIAFVGSALAFGVGKIGAWAFGKWNTHRQAKKLAKQILEEQKKQQAAAAQQDQEIPVDAHVIDPDK